MTRTIYGVIACALAALLVSCGSGDDGFFQESTSTPGPSGTKAARTRTPSHTASTPTVEPVSVPSPPAAFEDYPTVIAEYLSEAGDAALGDSCLEEVFDAWQLLLPDSDDWPCLVVNADADPDDEVVALLGRQSPESVDPMAMTQWQVFVIDPQADTYEVSYVSILMEVEAQVPAKPHLMAVDDINGDGMPELVYWESSCGAHTCYSTVHILGGGDYQSLTDGEISMPYADIRLEDRDGDGAQELIMTGGTIGSIGAGPQRVREEVYAWNGAAYTLAQTTYEPTNVLYLRILDADAAFANGDYIAARRMYQEAFNDTSLELWKENAGTSVDERDELEPYILFRIALCEIALGTAPQVSIPLLQQASGNYPGSLNAELAGAFLTQYLATGDVTASCAAARDFANTYIDLFTTVWDYGYANPGFDANAVCPF